MAVKVPLVRDSTTNLPIELSASDTIAKASVGLGSVDNTSDANKPISTATQTALNAKAGLTTTNTFTGANTFTGVNGLRVDGTGNGRLSLLNDGVRRALLSSSGEVVSLVAYQSDGGTPTGQLDIGTGGMKYWGSATVTGTLTASNLSGTNSGDQDLSGLAPLSNPRLSSSVPMGADVADTAAARANAPGVQGAGGVGSGGTILFGNGATNWGYIKGYFTDGVGNGVGRIIIGTRTSITDTAMTAKITVNESGATTFASTVTAANLSGTNTGDQDLSGLAPKNNPTFTGTVNVPYLIAGDSNGTASIRVGDDTNLWDVNVANTLGVKGAQDPSKGYIRFGSDTNGFGWDGTKLAYGAWTVWHSGNLDPASFATSAQGAKADAALPAANLVGFTKFAVVTALPGSPDPNTIYFVK